MYSLEQIESIIAKYLCNGTAHSWQWIEHNNIKNGQGRMNEYYGFCCNKNGIFTFEGRGNYDGGSNIFFCTPNSLKEEAERIYLFLMDRASKVATMEGRVVINSDN